MISFGKDNVNTMSLLLGEFPKLQKCFAEPEKWFKDLKKTGYK